MIILLILLVAILLVALFLRGEGDSYGSRNLSEGKKKSFFTSDKNYFL